MQGWCPLSPQVTKFGISLSEGPGRLAAVPVDSAHLRSPYAPGPVPLGASRDLLWPSLLALQGNSAEPAYPVAAGRLAQGDIAEAPGGLGTRATARSARRRALVRWVYISYRMSRAPSQRLHSKANMSFPLRKL